jgi:hypothetical protein
LRIVFSLPFYSPEGTHSEPGKRYSAAKDDGHATGAGVGGVIFSVLFDGFVAKNQGHQQEKDSGDLKPQLVEYAAEGTACGGCGIRGGPQSAVAPGLLRSDAGHHL